MRCPPPMVTPRSLRQVVPSVVRSPFTVLIVAESLSAVLCPPPIVTPSRRAGAISAFAPVGTSPQAVITVAKAAAQQRRSSVFIVGILRLGE